MNVNVPVSSNHPQSYAIIQNGQPPILSSGPTPVTALGPGQQQQQQQQQQHAGGGGGGDIHICGACGAQFTEIKEFITHKRLSCHATNVSGGQTVTPTQLTHTSTVAQPHPPPGSVMGVPVGMPHVVLQPATGPPQVYRIVLEPSVAPPPASQPSSPAPTPMLAQSLSGAPTNATPHLASPQSHHITSHHHHHLSPHSQPHHTPHHQQTTDTWHSAQPTPRTGGEEEAGRGEDGRGIIDDPPQQQQQHQQQQQQQQQPPPPLDDNSGGGVSGGSSSVSSETGPGPGGGGGMEGDSRGQEESSTMHTEEEDVATFLATQLASQAAPSHNTNVSEHLMSSVVMDGGSDGGDLACTTTTTTTTQPQSQVHHIHLPLHHHQQQVDSFSGGTGRGSGSSRRPTKATSTNTTITHDPNSMNVDTKPNILHKLVVHDGIHKEKSCPVKDCNFTTYHNKDLNRHIRKHTGEKPFQCEECGTSFSRGDKLKVHARIHSNVRPYWCDVAGCQYRAIDSGSLRKHKRTHTNERPYRCQLCPYSARDGSQLTVHLRTHTGDTPFQCMVEPNCSAAFKTSSDLRRHERLHTGVKPYKCTVCDYACAIKSNLAVHMKLNHFKGAKFSCTKCEFLGNSRKQLKDHEKSHANVLLQCELCDHVSTSNTGLRQHMLIHSQEKPYQCRYCAFTCKTTGNLRYHMRNKHGCEVSGRRRGTCPVRGRGGTMAMAGGVGGRRAGRPSCYRNFKCGDCGSGFVREDSYRSHMRQHEKHKMAQAISGKMESDVFSVVVQDEGLIGVDQSGGGTGGGAGGGSAEVAAAFHRLSTDALPPGTLISQSAMTSASAPQSSEGSVGGYSSYVITIDGISTVFSNPVRLSGSTVAADSPDAPDQIPGAVQVITGDIFSSPSPSASKVTTAASQQQHGGYDFSEDTKTQHGFDLTQQQQQDKISQTQHIYDLTPVDNKGEPGQQFSEPGGEGSSREYITTTSPQTAMSRTVLIEQPPNIDTGLDSSIQVHNLSAKPKIE